MSLFAVLVAVNELSNENFVIILEFLKFKYILLTSPIQMENYKMKYISTCTGKYIEFL